jgi:hypothetical protein
MKRNLVKPIALASLLLTAATDAQELYSANLWSIGKPSAPSAWINTDPTIQATNRATLTIEPGETAGVWPTDVWNNIAVNTTTTATLNGSEGGTATFKVQTKRNQGPYNWATLRDNTSAVTVDNEVYMKDGNATLLDGHLNGTEYQNPTGPVYPAYHVGLEVTGLTMPVYDVIIYFGINQAQAYSRKGFVNFNSGGLTTFTLPSGQPTTTLDEIEADAATGNYIKYSNVTGSSFTATVYGDDYTHMGPAGIQIREVTAVAGEVSAVVSTVVAAPTAIAADGSSTSTVTVTLRDASGLPVSGKDVTLANTAGPQAAVIAPLTPVTTDAIGQAVFTVSSSTPGAEVFTATDVTDSNLVIVQTASVNFIGPADAGVSTVGASRSSVVADGIVTSTITVTLKDAAGLPVQGDDVTLANTSGPQAAVIDPMTAVTTDANGVATFTVRSSTPGTEVFTATDTTDSLVITQTASVQFVDSATPFTIHVNFYASSGAAGDQVAQDPATLEGPVGGLGATWNQYNTQTGSDLLSSSGVVTGVGFTNNVPSGWRASTTGLAMLNASRAHFGKGADTTHTITGLAPGSYFHVWIASYNENASLEERALGEWSTPNPTTTPGPQMIDCRAGLNQTTWEQGLNYVLFEYVQADANGQIILKGDAADIGDYGGETTAKRLHLNGFQLVPTDAPIAMITSFGIPGSTGVIDEEAKTISLVVPAGTNLATFAPFFTLTSGTSNQTSGAPPSPTFAAQNPVGYVVTDTSTDPDTVNTYQDTVTVAAGIGTLVIDLGTGTTIEGGTYGSHGTNLPLPALPAGSVLRSIAADTVLEATDNENFASDLSLLLDPTPATPGEDFAVEITSGLTPLGGAGALKLGWPSVAAAPPVAPLVDTKTDADWAAGGPIDLSTFGLFIGNAYDHDSGIAGDGGTWSGTITLTYDIVGAASAYSTWSGGAPFGGDKNGDGVSNGLAFLLGSADADESALGRLPKVSENAGGLVLTFSILNAANRGPAVATVQWSNDLGTTDPWTTAPVPETSGTVGGVTFVVTPNGNLNDVVATIPAGEAAGGMLFGRVAGTEN